LKHFFAHGFASSKATQMKKQSYQDYHLGNEFHPLTIKVLVVCTNKLMMFYTLVPTVVHGI
jgi:hypothetical protein